MNSAAGTLRRYLLVLAVLRAALPFSAPAEVNAPASPLREEARRLASQPYAVPKEALPPPFASLDYDAYRSIRPQVGRAAMLPLGNGFAADLLPPGLYFPYPVTVEIPNAEGGFVERPFSPSIFDFASTHFDQVPDSAPGAGFSGLRLRSALNTEGVLDEVLVMQGASYFRAIGQSMGYGLSARAVAIGTGEPTPEEFPRFTRIRLHPAMPGSVRLEAVMDSPSLSGHLDLTLRPGADTAADVVVTLFPRCDITNIGVAPLTSMYFKGPLGSAVADDFRPRVHDSDVLVIENGAGEILWRPLTNPADVQISAFVDRNPVAFGLWQTRRSFADYEDSEARYHFRPSARIQLNDTWGDGAIVLVEIPTGDEFLDNIVAFWRPAAPLRAGQAYRFSYQLTWTLTSPKHLMPHSILQSRSGREHDQPGARRFVVDFLGDASGYIPDLSVSGDAEVRGLSLFSLPEGRGTRVTFLLTPDERNVAELRLQLRDDAGAPASPVWLHRWTRARDGGV